VGEKAVIDKIDNFQTHVVPIIADIDAGFGNEEATYLLAKKMIEAGACCLQIENQVSDVKQCGHQDGKVTVPHEDFIAKINALRYAFLEMVKYDDTQLAAEADQRIKTFQRDASQHAGIFHHLITLPTYHTAALSTDSLAKD